MLRRALLLLIGGTASLRVAPFVGTHVTPAAASLVAIRGGCSDASTMGLLDRKAPAEEPVNEIPPLEQHPRRKVALLVEPTPFTHVSGYSNRFKEMLRFLKAGGDEAEVITPDDTPDRPTNYLGMPITYIRGFRFPLYKQIQLTMDIGFGALRRLRTSRPTLIHSVAPVSGTLMEPLP